MALEGSIVTNKRIGAQTPSIPITAVIPTALEKEMILRAVPQAQGNVAQIARIVGQSRRWVYARLHGDVQLLEALEDVRATMVDDIETALFFRAQTGDTKAIKLFLSSTWAAGRGWSDPPKAGGKGGGSPEEENNDPEVLEAELSDQLKKMSPDTLRSLAGLQ
jgi:Bacterial regulatory protein, Fis family